jgi:hypothetical protein
MERNHRNSPLNKRQGEVKQFHYQTQKNKVFAALLKAPKTMLMVAHETGIERANICRHIASLRAENRVRVYRYGLCKITKHRAGYLTTDPEIFPAYVSRLKHGRK